MTIEHSEDTAHVGVTGPAEPPTLESSPGSADSVVDAAARADAGSGVLEGVQGTHDSTPPLSRKLAPPPKPKRDSGAASAPPGASASGRPAEGPDLTASASALKAPLAPTISFSASGEPTLDSPAMAAAELAPTAAGGAIAPLSQPPPMRRRSPTARRKRPRNPLPASGHSTPQPAAPAPYKE